MRPGTPVGQLRIPRLALDTILVDGTDAASLKKGPGVFRGDGLPGEGRLVYVAGHRTTYGAPFGHIERLKRGDKVTIQVPYGTFVYAVTRYRIVTRDDVAVLRSYGGEQLILQSCHPRFSASHRFLVYAQPIGRALPERKRKVSRA
jgi:sortase A